MDDTLRAEDIRIHNMRKVLSLIHASRNSGGLSQSDIVNRLSLKAPTAFRIFTSLESEGMISPIGYKNDSEGAPKSGRKPVYFNIRSDARYVVSVEFWASCISIGVFNFSCDNIYTKLVNLTPEDDADLVVSRIGDLVEEAIEATSIDRSQIIGLGVAAPGKVSVTDGVVIYYGRINGLENYPLKEALERRTGLNVLVHNNCSAMAYCLYNERSKSSGSIFAFLLRSGVNGSLVNENGIFLSADNTTLEAGHLIVKPDGMKCTCGMRGCLQAQLMELDKGYGESGSSYKSLFDSVPDGAEGDAMIEKAAQYIHIAVKDIQRFSAPESFIIICSSAFVAERIAMALRDRLSRETDFFAQNDPTISGMGYDTSLALRGAMQLVLADFFGR